MINQDETIIALGALNLFQLFYWGFTVQRLVNKLMSRNFAEYNAVINPPTEVASNLTHKEYEEAKEEQAILDELNGMIKH